MGRRYCNRLTKLSIQTLVFFLIVWHETWINMRYKVFMKVKKFFANLSRSSFLFRICCFSCCLYLTIFVHCKWNLHLNQIGKNEAHDDRITDLCNSITIYASEHRYNNYNTHNNSPVPSVQW